MNEPIKAVLSVADFGPYFEGETFVDLTFRVPADTRLPAGTFTIQVLPGEPATIPDWAKSKAQKAAGK